ncbi:Fe(2+) transporter permease subunit FeoB [Coxiella endosymbiont of Amblyomma nuttalli]|uniref:Fe(2+) transporter permease subunit FeoB n=1 Tax=Coxiella endosymbiont of Amblyomma nuttalli TaxID=2749996 RepID=UPI001FD08FB3|nr:Fe(2+) transporter permease subunit FeoB [Coxiella endosymbiont of Amblyomma nuttalli]
MTIVLAGNPNCGKTAVFNALTRSRQQVGNWPGLTVDKKYGYFQHQGIQIKVVDLPGVYSSVVFKEGAIDEKIACQYLLSGEADIVINVIDGNNLERNLYLTLQLLEMNIPTILAINMMDIVKERNLEINLKQLSKLLNCPVVSLIACQNKGIDSLKDTIVIIKKDMLPKFALPLPIEIKKAICLLSEMMMVDHVSRAQWLALRLLEDDHFTKQVVNPSILKESKREMQFIKTKLNEESDILIADARYMFVNKTVNQVTQLAKMPCQSLTQRIDYIVLNRFLAIPILFGVMYLMFLFSINIGGAFQSFFDISSNTIFVDGLSRLLIFWHCPVWLTVILAGGIGRGINTTITFTPVIGGMFLFFAFLEDSGYMVRAAFIMDRLMRALGLPGKSFVPMIMGFGCNVPAVVGARMLENQRDRVLTVMMMPFMSCGARLAIFAVFASAFFPKNGAIIIFGLYCIGILVAVLSGLVLRKTILPGKPAPLIMELPPYHIPRVGSLWRHMWQRLQNFLFQAGRYIVPVCAIIGVLNSVTVGGKLVRESDQQSLLSVAGRMVTPLFTPLGIKRENWPAIIGLTTGILAKEVVVGTLNSLYNERCHVTQQIASQFDFFCGLADAVKSIPKNLGRLGNAFKNPITATANKDSHEIDKIAYGVMYQQFDDDATAAFPYLLFILLYFPCISTMAVMQREIGKQWALFSALWSTGLAYVLAVICYQLLTIAYHPWTTLCWVVLLLAALTIVVALLRYYASSHLDRRNTMF